MHAFASQTKKGLRGREGKGNVTTADTSPPGRNYVLKISDMKKILGVQKCKSLLFREVRSVEFSSPYLHIFCNTDLVMYHTSFFLNKDICHTGKKLT